MTQPRDSNGRFVSDKDNEEPRPTVGGALAGQIARLPLWLTATFAVVSLLSVLAIGSLAAAQLVETAVCAQ